jgi:hypothetical protein
LKLSSRTYSIFCLKIGAMGCHITPISLKTEDKFAHSDAFLNIN